MWRGCLGVGPVAGRSDYCGIGQRMRWCSQVERRPGSA